MSLHSVDLSRRLEIRSFEEQVFVVIFLPELRCSLQSDDGKINHQRGKAVERAVEEIGPSLRMLIIDVPVFNRRQSRQRWDEKPVEIHQRVGALVDQNISMLQIAMRARRRSLSALHGVKPLIRQMPQMLLRIRELENALDVDIQGRPLYPIHNQDRIPRSADNHAIRHVLKSRQRNVATWRQVR